MNKMKKKQSRKSKIEKAIDKVLVKGVEMTKLVRAGGFFFGATYDTRTIYTLDEVLRLSNKGFKLVDDAGILAFNILIKAS